jgi:TolB-like protein/class 3 adenylate cyclase
MASPRIQRRLAAVLAADVAGYARLMENDERGTFGRLRAHRAEVFEPLVGEHRGRIVKHTGDGALCEFPSIVDAVACAMLIQQGVAERESAVPEGARIRYRIGVNLGDIILEDDGDIYGDGVNLAARLEALADPGGISISSAAFEHLHGKLDCAYEDLGEKAIKHLERPVRVYRVLPPGAAALARPAPPAAALALPDRPSIAVLPFDDMSVDPEQDFFADGITEDITTALCKFRGFFVIARNTMFTYKGRAVDVRTVGRELGVRYVLEGSVRRLAGRIRVNAQLIEAATSNHLWAERYDRGLEDIFAIQDEITASVVGRIGPELLAAEHARASRKPPQSLDAWECVIRALFHSSHQSEEETRTALGHLDRAIEIDPAYAQALGMKAWILVFRAFQGWEEMGQALGAVKPLIARALAADGTELWAFLAQGMVGYAIRDNDLAVTALTRAVNLNPNSVNAQGLLGIAHAFGGRPAEALLCIDRAVRLSPRDTFLSDFQLYYAFAHFQAARYEQGLQHAQQSHDMRPGHPYPLVMAAACAGHLGLGERAASLVRELKSVLPIASVGWVETTSPYVRAEDRGRLVEGLRRAGLN